MTFLQSEIQVSKSDYRNGRVVSSLQSFNLKPGGIVAQVEHFALTSNNVTYALVGKSFRYFDFYDTMEKTDGNNFGIFPVWGVATVIKSTLKNVRVGRKIYGFMPAGTHAVMQIDEKTISNNGFSALRSHLPKDRAVYNKYLFCDTDPLHSERHLAAMLIYRPLYFTSFFLDDYISYNNFFGASNVVVISASSKTGFTTGFLLGNNKSEATVLGLTSSKNVGYVKSLNIFKEVAAYDDITNFSQSKGKFVLIDIAGNKRILQQLSDFLGDRIAKTILVGRSHPEGAASVALPKNLNSEFFFAPGWIQKRTSQLGSQLHQRMASSWQMCLQNASSWTSFNNVQGGMQGVLQSYQQLASGKSNPREGIIISLKSTSSKL